MKIVLSPFRLVRNIIQELILQSIQVLRIELVSGRNFRQTTFRNESANSVAEVTSVSLIVIISG